MNNLQIFDYKGKEVRTIEKDEVNWWVLKDVCEILDINQPTRVAERLDEDEVNRIHISHPQSKDKTLEMLCVNESGLYNVILRSDKEEAKPLRKWVTSEVLPSISRYEAYITPEKLEEVIHTQSRHINYPLYCFKRGGRN